ncbi:MAG TPA: M15 family metallopeptidase [Mycobacteriales bacterium]|nr:M15 family metallopeptidase [Mycobacteriales bacterium]
MIRTSALPRVVAGVLAAALLAGCSAQAKTKDSAATPRGGPAPTALGDAGGAPLPALHARLRPDVIVTGPLTGREVRAVASLAPTAVAFSTGTVRVGRALVRVASVDPATFRRFAPAGTAEATALWQALAAGQLVASHEAADRLRLVLGREVTLRGTRTATVRLGGLATTGIPGTDLLVSTATGIGLGVTRGTAILLTAGKSDPTALAAKARRAAGSHGDVDLLSAPASNPLAFLTGGRAAKAFGAFSYRYYPDGTIEPDARWVRQNITSERVPLLGTITCHRLMFPQLRSALHDVVEAGLSAKVRTFSGCYVPRFIERDPSHGVSLHTWGIAIDLDAPSNARGTRGSMDPRVVAIFKRWGFRWGGDWSWTDPMHFELGALLSSR